MEILLALVVLGILVAPLLISARHSTRIAALEGEREQLAQAISNLLARIFVLEHAAPRQSSYRAQPVEERAPEPRVAATSTAASVALPWEPMPARLRSSGPTLPLPVAPKETGRSEARPVFDSAPAAADDADRHEPDDSATPEPVPTPAEAPAPPPRIEWEQWIGVRGAAALGAGILVIALLFFVRYSMDQGWLSPTLRVLFGAGFSAAILGVAQARLHERYRVLSSWLSGAGVAGLFASLWAAHHIVPLIGAGTSFVAFVALAAACLALASFRDSMPIALLGAAGGFAAPLAIAASQDRPLGVLAYVLVLDAALLALALKKRWWVLSALALLASSAYEAVWLSAHASSGIAPLHVAIMIIFAGLFAAVPALSSEAEVEPALSPARLMRLAALLLPFLFALELVTHAAVVAQPLPIGVLLVSVTFLACGLARIRREPQGLLLVVLGNVLVALAWSRGATLGDHVPAIAGLALALTLPFAGLAFIERATPGPVRDQLGSAGAMMTASMIVLLTTAAASSGAAWAAALGALALLALVGVGISRWTVVGSFATIALSAGAVALGLVGGSPLLGSRAAAPAAVALVTSLLLAMIGGWLARRAERRAPIDVVTEQWVGSVRVGAGVALLVSLALLLPLADRLPLFAFAGLLTAILASGITLAHRWGSAHTSLALALGLALAVCAWRSDASTPVLSLVTVALSGALVAASFWPRLGLAKHAGAPLANAAVLTAGSAALALRFSNASEAGALAAVTAAAAALTLVVTVRFSPGLSGEAEQWLGGLAVAATTVALVLLFQNEQLTWGLSLFGLALVALGTKLRRDAAIVLGLIHLGVSAVRLLANPWVLGYHPRGAIPVLNWITPTYGVPALAIGAAWWLLSRPNAESLENDYKISRRMLATLALALSFVWLNLAVIDIHATGPWLTIGADASDARNLSISAVWACYGVSLLILGLSRKSVPLRWASLGLILVTAGKVFMYDLGNLRDLYRVASLAGLAISLLAISVLYQRFVFGPLAKREVRGAGGA